MVHSHQGAVPTHHGVEDVEAVARDVSSRILAVAAAAAAAAVDGRGDVLGELGSEDGDDAGRGGVRTQTQGRPIISSFFRRST